MYRLHRPRITSRHLALLLTTALVIGLVLVLAPGKAHAACEEASSFDQYRSRGWTWAFLAAFGFGFLTSLTPCVYPMIPIVLGVFGARGEQVSRGKAMILATLYVVGMGVMYAALGVIFALVGGQFGSLLAKPAVVIPIVLLYALLATSMFGAFELNLPASWQAKLNTIGGAGYGGAFGMGLVGGFTAAPCTGPFLVGMLGFVAQSGNVPVGASLLFTYALGMGVLFWVLATFAVSLPRSGRWMEWVKSVGGIGLMAAALYFLRPIVPALRELGRPDAWFLAVSLVVGGVGLAAGAIHLSFHDSRGIKIRKGIAVVLTVAGITGAIAWMLTPNRHLPWIRRDKAAVEKLVTAESLQVTPARADGEPWLHPAEAAAFAKAHADGKGVMIDFAANWCTPCSELELTFADEEVFGALTGNFVPLKVDVSEGSDEDEALQDRYKSLTLPAVVFLDADGKEVGRVSRFMKPDEMLKVVQPAVARLHGAAGDDPCVAVK
ncbi:MAG: thioredoxin family protein [Kofleriaceae bacterium]|nr:thioredoxin family protein [Myxococcales bacterium]MCB9571080.1 thioredoxin family protein [Kofleriaceae bacterium]